MKHVVLAALLALSTPFAHAAPPSDAQVDKLLEVMRARQTVEAMLPQVEVSQQQMVEQLTAGQPLTDQQRQDLQRILATSSRRVREALAWDKLQPLYRDIYRQTFTGEDMDAMIGFYSGSAGQKLLDKMPQLMQNTMTAMQKVIVPMIEQMQRDVAAEMQAPPVPSAPSAPPAPPAAPTK